MEQFHWQVLISRMKTVNGKFVIWMAKQHCSISKSRQAIINVLERNNLPGLQVECSEMSTSSCAASSKFANLEQISFGQHCVVYQPGAIFTQDFNGKGWKSCSNRKAGLHYSGLWQGQYSFTNSFTTQSSLQWHLCATTPWNI